MTDAKTTPWTAGPWTARTPFSPPGTNERKIGIQSPMQMIGYVHGCYIGDDDEQEMLANARLIAAAPELAAMVLELRDSLCVVDTEYARTLIDKADELLKRIGKQVSR